MAFWSNALLFGAPVAIAQHYKREHNKKKNNQYISPRANVTNTLGGNRAKGLENRMRFGGSKPVFAYPIDIDVDQDHIQISQYKYRRPGTGAGAKDAAWDRMNASAPGAATAGMQFEGSVVLPMPKVSDANSAEWGKSQVDGSELRRLQMEGVGLGAGQRGLDDRQREAATESGANAGQFSGPGRGGKGMGGEFYFQNQLTVGRARKVADDLGGTVKDDQVIGRARGQIMNPNAELLFEGPTLREFGFKWQLVARSQREGQMIRQIIRKFKIGAAPKFNNTSLMEFPDIFHIKYMKGRNELMTANRFEQLALTSMLCDYAPDGTWTTYDDSQPISIRMELNFKELRPIWRKHHEDFAPSMSVGY